MKKIVEDNLSLLSVQCFLKWCYNFKGEDIDKLCAESSEFKHVWNEYILPSAEGKIAVDYLVIVDTLFGKVSFKTMQKVMDIAMDRYLKEETDRLKFSLDIEKKRESFKKV